MLDCKYRCMSYNAKLESPDSIKSYQSDTSLNLQWTSVFVLPPWLQTWRKIFGKEKETLLLSVHGNGKIIGIAPLMREGNTAYFLGSTNVCDYMDFITTPGMEMGFFHEVINYLRNNGIKRIDLAHIRPEATVLTYLKPIAEKYGYKVEVIPEEISLETELPANWDDYLVSLTRKQRHEVRRKLRRLQEAGNIDYEFDSMPVNAFMNVFLGMFTESRRDKADFLTEQMERFFRLLAENMSAAGLLKPGTLKLNDKPIACIMCFDYNNCIYLYNSGYDPEYNYLSAGLLSKVMGIRESINNGKKHFDFLKGSEPYKYHLGGREVTLSRCVIDLE